MSNLRRLWRVPVVAALVLSGLRSTRLFAGPGVASADVSIAKALESADPVHPGDVVTFSINVSNAGPNAATNVVWSDTLPPNTTLDEFDPPSGSNCTSPSAGGTGTITCTIASLPANGTAGPYFIELLPSGAGSVSNTATVTASTPDPNPDNNSSSAVGNVALNAVPAASGWALGVLALAMAAGGILVLRR